MGEVAASAMAILLPAEHKEGGKRGTKFEHEGQECQHTHTGGDITEGVGVIGHDTTHLPHTPTQGKVEKGERERERSLNTFYHYMRVRDTHTFERNIRIWLERIYALASSRRLVILCDCLAAFPLTACTTRTPLLKIAPTGDGVNRREREIERERSKVIKAKQTQNKQKTMRHG